MTRMPRSPAPGNECRGRFDRHARSAEPQPLFGCRRNALSDFIKLCSAVGNSDPWIPAQPSSAGAQAQQFARSLGAEKSHGGRVDVTDRSTNVDVHHIGTQFRQRPVTALNLVAFGRSSLGECLAFPLRNADSPKVEQRCEQERRHEGLQPGTPLLPDVAGDKEAQHAKREQGEKSGQKDQPGPAVAHLASHLDHKEHRRHVKHGRDGEKDRGRLSHNQLRDVRLRGSARRRLPV